MSFSYKTQHCHVPSSSAQIPQFRLKILKLIVVDQERALRDEKRAEQVVEDLGKMAQACMLTAHNFVCIPRLSVIGFDKGLHPVLLSFCPHVFGG